MAAQHYRVCGADHWFERSAGREHRLPALSGGVGAPGISPLRANASGSAGKSYTRSLDETEQKVANELGADQLREFRSFAERATRDQSLVRALGNDQREGDELASRMSTAVGRLESPSRATLSGARSPRGCPRHMRPARCFPSTWRSCQPTLTSSNATNALASEYGSDSLALQAAMASELASRALPDSNSIRFGVANDLRRREVYRVDQQG